MVLGDKIICIISFIILFIKNIITMNSIVIGMLDIGDLSHMFLHSKEVVYLCYLMIISIYISYKLIKREIRLGSLIYFFFVQIFPYCVIFVFLYLKNDYLYVHYESEEFLTTLLWMYIHPIAFLVGVFIYYLCRMKIKL